MRTDTDERAVLQFSDGTSNSMTFAGAAEIVNAEEAKGNQNKSYSSPLVEIRWQCKNWPLPPDVALIDTPGFAQIPRFGERPSEANDGRRSLINIALADRVEHYLHRADLAIWVQRATKLQDKGALDALDIVRQRGRPIYFALSRWDNISEDDRARVLKTAHSLLCVSKQDSTFSHRFARARRMVGPRGNLEWIRCY
ncbi:MAG: hypothetical protein M5R36_05500 [Deltaproteobacteria bacterium]|nr:hypothetical protein [Deltaproteobacteria bacterium]